MKSSWIIHVGPNPMTSVLIRNRTREDTTYRGRDNIKTETERLEDVGQPRNVWSHQKLED